MADDSNSQSPSGAEPHNSYGVKPQEERSSDPTPASDSQDVDPRSMSPSGAEPHNSYGTPAGKEGGSGSEGGAPTTVDAFGGQDGKANGENRSDIKGKSKL